MTALHFAISRLTISANAIIRPGLYLTQAYAHVFAHPMLAVKPPEGVGTHHPAPWTAVRSSGFLETSSVQLSVEYASEDAWGAAIYQAREMMALLRIVAGSPVRAPVWCTVPFAEIASGKEKGDVYEFEPPLRWSIPDFDLTRDIIVILPDLLKRLTDCRNDDNFSAAFALLDSMSWIPSLGAQMIAIWSAAETLMQPSRSSMTKELARLVREALGTSRSDGDRLYNEVTRLCAARGSAAHAGREPEPLSVQDLYQLVRRLIIHALLDETNINLPIAH